MPSLYRSNLALTIRVYRSIRTQLRRTPFPSLIIETPEWRVRHLETPKDNEIDDWTDLRSVSSIAMHPAILDFFHLAIICQSLLPYEHDQCCVLPNNWIVSMIMNFLMRHSDIRRTLPSKTVRFINQEQQAKKHHHTANFRKSNPDIGLSFSTCIIVLGKWIVVFRSKLLVFASRREEGCTVCYCTWRGTLGDGFTGSWSELLEIWDVEIFFTRRRFQSWPS